jgi:hypothetical protein
MTDRTYDVQFYADISDGSRRSAAVVVPLVLRLVPSVQSVVDFGCGSGTWLAEFSVCGVPDLLGLDFGEGTSEYLFIPRERFRVCDLASGIEVPRRHLAMSLEVAEHMPDSAARAFVRTLTCAADVVLFSAATPLQGGHNHVNERWPSYWIRLFAEHGYECHDVLRPIIWNDKRVEWWYRQNLLLFTQASCASSSALRAMASFHGADLVHPDNLVHMATKLAATRTPSAGGASARGGAGVHPSARESGEPLRPLTKLVDNVELAVRRLAWAVQGKSSEQFNERWRAHVERKTIVRSGFFDQDWYTRTYPDVAESGLDPLRHFLQHGAAERRDPGPRFSVAAYVAQDPSAASSGINPLLHFLERRETILRSGLFDADWYARTYPDVAQSALDPLSHYLQYGAAEQRDPGPGFSVGEHLARHPWLSRARINPLVHFLEHRVTED